MRMNIIFAIVYLIWLISCIQAQNNGDLKLTNDSILEIFLNGEWGSACDDFWSLANTDVACRILGYRRGKSFQNGITSDTESFHFDDVICLGNESNIMECQHRLGDDCSPIEHIRISCEKYGCESYAPFADSAETFVKLYVEEQWYYLSDEDFTSEIADVICRENTQTTVESYTYYNRDPSSQISIFPHRISCIGTERNLCQCTNYVASHTSELIVKIKCRSNEGQLRLVSGVNRNSGFVLINHEETWKGICISKEVSNFQLAYVACKNLGYKGLYNFYYDDSLKDVIIGGDYYYNTDTILFSWLMQVNCTGDEQNVIDCEFDGWEDFVCLEAPLWVNCEPYESTDVKLIDSASEYEGFPRIFHNEQWLSHCASDGAFDSNIGHAMCRSIGAPSLKDWYIVTKVTSNNLEIQFSCFRNESSLEHCIWSEKTNCSGSEQIYISCNPPSDKTPSITLGSTETGIIEIYVDEQWGISCIDRTDEFEQADAQVICKQLGLRGVDWQPIEYTIREQYYWDSVFNCSGTESSLSEGECLQTPEFYDDVCPQISSYPVKILCRPAANEMRLLPVTNSNFSIVQFLTPERSWAPVCTESIDIQFCGIFGYNSVDETRFVTDNAHTYTVLDCPNTELDQCNVRFKYDYISYYGCRRTLQIACNNLQAPSIIPENLQGISLSHDPVLLMWDYQYRISEEHMNISYLLDTTTSIWIYRKLHLNVSVMERDHSKVNRRYYEITGLESYTEYTFKLQMVNSAGAGPFGDTVIVTTHESVPTGVPTNIQLRSIGATQLTIQWEQVRITERNGVILGYNVCIRISSIATCNNNDILSYISAGNIEPYQLIETELLPDTQYTIVISAYNSKGSGPDSEPQEIRTGLLIPTITSPEDDQSFTITSIYELELFSLFQDCTSTGVPTPTITWTSNTNTHITGQTDYILSIQDEDLRLDIDVNIFTCTATNQIGFDTKSIEVIIDIVELAVPQPPRVEYKDKTYIDIEWADYSSSVYTISYEICVRTSVENECIQSITTINTEYSIVNLEANTQYMITIVAITVFGRSPESDHLLVTTNEPDPIAPEITVPNEDQLISISSISELESFSLIQECNSTGVPESSIEWTSNVNIHPNGYVLKLLPENLIHGIDVIIFTCTASNKAGEDMKSIYITIQIQINPVSKLISISKDTTYIGIQWAEYDKYTAYLLYYEICLRVIDSDDCIRKVEVTNTQHLFENLLENTLYSITVITVTTLGSSLHSETLQVETSKIIINTIEPLIDEPRENISFVITNILDLETFSLQQACTSSGLPEPIIVWTLNTNYLSNDYLVIQPGDLSIDDNINPYIFTCTATNRVGEDSRIVTVIINIDISKEIEELENVTAAEANNFSRIIGINLMGINVADEQNITKIQDFIDKNAEDLENLINKFTESNTVTEENSEVVENLLIPASEIIQKDIELTLEIEYEETMVEKGSVTSASKGIKTALNSVESLASNFVSNLPTEETMSASISSSAITLIAENIILPPKTDDNSPTINDIIIPDLSTSKNEDIKEKIKIPIEVARMFSTNNTKLRIATTIVKTDRKSKNVGSQSKSPRLSSNIISVVVPGYESEKKITLPQPIRLSIPVRSTNVLEFQNCSFLNSSSWSTFGLNTTYGTVENLTFCDTDHFTSFAVFVTPRKLGDDSDLNRVASIVSYILVSISFVALLVSLVLFLLSARNFFKLEANIIYFNYCLAMTLAFGIFLFGIETGKFNKILCMVIAFLLHYIWLAVFVWTLCNGLLILYKLTIGILKEHKIYIYLILFGWISPIIIPIITIAIKHNNYVKPEEHCFLTYEDGIIWSFIGPILAILSINMIILIIACVRIATTKFGTEKINEKDALRKGIVSSLILTPLLGIPWLLLLLNIFIPDPIIQWSFILVNGLMGVFFFIAVTMRNTEVRKLCARISKDTSRTSTSGYTDAKTSGMLSKKFKRSLSREPDDTLPPTPGDASKKGEYCPLGPVLRYQGSEDSNSLKSPTDDCHSRYDASPKPKILPKPKRLQKSSSASKESFDECDRPHYDIPRNLKPIPIYDILTSAPEVKEPKCDSPIYEELREEDIIADFGNKPDFKSTKVSEKKLYQNLDSLDA